MWSWPGRICAVADEYPESRRTLGHVEHFSPPPRAFVSAPADNLVWGEITAGAREGLRAVSEQTLFPGALVLALAVFGLFSDGWPRRLRIGLAVAALAAAIFSMGLAFLDGRLTYRLLFDYAPGWEGSRTPGRLHTLTTLFLALLAAAGAQAFVSPGGPLQTRARPWLAPAVCLMFVLVILLEGSAFRRIDGTLAGPAHPTAPPPPQGLRQAQAPLIHLPADDAFTSVDDPFTYRDMVWSTEGFPELERSTVEQAMERALETTFPVSPVELIVVERGPRPQRLQRTRWRRAPTTFEPALLKRVKNLSPPRLPP